MVIYYYFIVWLDYGVLDLICFLLFYNYVERIKCISYGGLIIVYCRYIYGFIYLRLYFDFS